VRYLFQSGENHSILYLPLLSFLISRKDKTESLLPLFELAHPNLIIIYRSLS